MGILDDVNKDPYDPHALTLALVGEGEKAWDVDFPVFFFFAATATAMTRYFLCDGSLGGFGGCWWVG